VPISELIGHCNDFAKLLWNKCVLCFTVGDISCLWSDGLKSDYDDEYTYLMAQKTRIDLGRAAEVTDVTFDRRVSECITATIGRLNDCRDGERAYYSTRLAKLREVETSRVLSKKEHIRIKPYGILLNGPSGVGKSAIVNALLRYVLKVNNKDHSPRAIVTLNQQDKFQSEFATHHKGVILDDLCNTNETKQDGSPVESVIMFLNQIPMAALNPNAEMKGKVMIEPDVVCGTTNVKDLLSNIYSNEPLSINRRFEVTITQTVAPKYRLGNTDMLDTDKISHMSKDSFPSFARFTVERPQYPVGESSDAKKSKSGKKRTIQFVPIVYKGRELKNIKILELLEFLKNDSRNHFSKQQKFVDGQKDRVNMDYVIVVNYPIACVQIPNY
jgi:ABC-type dipeptide/oligopeptide/nickel transport system ATPase component